jgi:hypothetical protein
MPKGYLANGAPTRPPSALARPYQVRIVDNRTKSEPTVITVQGAPIANDFGLDLFAFKLEGYSRTPWVVAEASSGFVIAGGVLRKHAIQIALETITTQGLDRTKQLIARTVAKYGALNQSKENQ